MSEYIDNIEYDIEFSYNDDILSFYTKNHKFYECKDNNEELEKNVIDKFNEFTKNKINILLVINNLNNICSIDIYNLKELFFNNNILLDHSNNYLLLDNFPDKYKVILLGNRDDRFYNYIRDKSESLINKLLNKYKFMLLSHNHALDYIPKITRYSNIPKYFWNSLYCGYNPIIKNKYNWFDKFNNFFPNNFQMPLIKYGITSRNVLSKNDFFNLYNLDIKKKTVTIFLFKFIGLWDINFKYYSVETQYIITNKLKNLISFLSKDYNVILRIHPSNVYIKNKEFNFKKRDINIDKSKFNSIDDILKLYEGLNIVEDQFILEVFKYTDYGINFSAHTSIFELLYLYDIPLLYIKNNNYNPNELFIGNAKSLKYSIVPEINDKNIFNIMDNKSKFLYGITYNDENIKKNDNNLYHAVTSFLNTNHNKNYKYFKNNPFYSDEYYNDNKTMVSVLTNKINQLI